MVDVPVAVVVQVYRKFGIFWEITRYGPLYMAVNCSVLVCLRSACVDFSGVDFRNGFRIQRYLGRHMRQSTGAFDRISCVST